MARQSDETTVWIGYADFLTTIAVLFFILAVAMAGKIPNLRPGYVRGEVSDSASGRPLSGCSAVVGSRRLTATPRDGRFVMRVDSILRQARVDVTVECAGYEPFTRFLRVAAGDPTRVVVRVRPVTRTVWETITLDGDALFDPLQFRLKPEGLALIVNSGHRLKQDLQPGQTIVVQGHTDDLPIVSAPKDNWMLSGERAAAAALVLTDPRYGVGIPECQVTIMGFGPSRPRLAVQRGDSRAELARKRALNRRLEFRRLSGTDLIGGKCAS
jgi:outer membrane protein OmpA-like peptidoglycan-associated protein